MRVFPLCIKALGHLMRAVIRKKHFRIYPHASVPDKEPAVSPQPVATAEPEEALDDGALIAAITAAISAAMAEEGYTGGFRVVSFKRAARRNRF